MKTLIIFILLFALAAGAALSRPGEDNFKQYFKQKQEAAQTNVLGKLGADIYSDQYLKACEFNNRVLWTTVRHDGKQIYVGAFSHWWGSDEKK